ncbi:MAG: energy-coupling factor transporter transmembrane component T [Aeromicrobium sp.]
MRSWVLNLNPLVQLSFGLFSLVGSFWIRSLPVALCAVAAYALMAIVFLPGWRYPLACLGFTVFAAVTIVYSTWRLGGRDWEEALVAGLRIVVLAWPGSVMAGYVDPARLSDHLAQSLKLPARLVVAFSAAMQRFVSFGHTWQALDRVRRVRGTGPGRNPAAHVKHAASMSFALLVHAMRGASTSAVAMDARGFATAQNRTWAEPARWTRSDRAALALAAALGVVPLAARLLSAGGMI